MCEKTHHSIGQSSNYGNQSLELFFMKYILLKIALKHVLFPCPIQVNNSFLPTRLFTSYRIKTIVFRMILICDVVFGLVYKIEVSIEHYKLNHARYLYGLHIYLNFYIIYLQDSCYSPVLLQSEKKCANPDQLDSQKPADLDLHYFKN